MNDLKNLRDLLGLQIQDLYHAENRLTKMIPTLIEKSTNDELKRALNDYMEKTEQHKTRLEEACEILAISPEGKICQAIQGILLETESFLKNEAPAAVMDAGIIANVQRAQHYEIAGYGTVARYAKLIEEEDVTKLLIKSLQEEEDSDERLTEIAESVNRIANEGGRTASSI